MAIPIMENLWQVGGDELTHPADAAIYLVRFGPQAALIDAGCGRGHQRLKANVDQCLPPDVELAYLLLTHCHYDHTGGAAAVRADPDWWLHRLPVEWPFPPHHQIVLPIRERAQSPECRVSCLIDGLMQ